MNESLLLSSEPITPGHPLAMLPDESLEAYEAFMCYFELGQQRSIAKAAAELGASESTLGHWSSRYGWRSRLRAYRKQLAGARLNQVDTTAARLDVTKAQQNLEQLNMLKVLGSFLLQSAQKLFQHQLLTNPDKIDMNQILKMMAMGQKLMTATENSDDLLQSIDGAALEQKFREAGEWVYAQKKAAELAAKGCDYTEGEGI